MAYTKPNFNEDPIPSEVGMYPNYKKMSSTILGICQVMITIALFGINVAEEIHVHQSMEWVRAYAVVLDLAYFGLCGTTAAFVLAAGRSPRRVVVIVSTLLSITTAVFIGCTAVRCAVVIPFYAKHLHLYYVHSVQKLYMRRCVIIYSVELVASVAMMFVSIWSSVLGCKVTCCGGHYSQVASGQETYPLNQQQDSAHVSDAVLEPQQKV